MVEHNTMYQQLQKICMEKVCRIKVFRGNLSKMLFASLKVAYSHNYG